MHSDDKSVFPVQVHLLRGISSTHREMLSNIHHLAIAPHPKQNLDINPLDYNDSISLSSHFFYPSRLDFRHPYLIPNLEVGIHDYNPRLQYR